MIGFLFKLIVIAIIVVAALRNLNRASHGIKGPEGLIGLSLILPLLYVLFH
jgi:hypothetical protein